MKNLFLLGAITLLLASCGSSTEEAKVETTDSVNVVVPTDTIVKTDSVKVDTTSVK